MSAALNKSRLEFSIAQLEIALREIGECLDDVSGHQAKRIIFSGNELANYIDILCKE